MTGVLRPVTEVTISAAFVFGMLLALLGSLKLALARGVETGGRRGGAFPAAFNFALIPMLVFAGMLVDAFGARDVLVVSSLLTALGIFALSFRPDPPRAFAAALLAGFGAAGLGIGGLVLMPDAFFPDKPTASLNLGVVFFALGALVTPALADVLLRLFGGRRAVGLLALACLVPVVVAGLTSAEDLRAADSSPADVAGLLSHNSLWMAAIVFALYAPLEGSVSSRATAYLADRGVDERRAVRYLAGFWATLLLSRLTVAGLAGGAYLRESWDAAVLVVPALLAAAVLGNMAGTVGPDRAGRGLVVLGFCLGPILPTLLGMVHERMAAAGLHCYGTAYGMLFAAGSLGGLVLSPLAGPAARGKAAPAALRVPMFGALLLAAVALVFGLAA
jgi:fucose permease